MIPGAASHTTLEKITAMQRIAEDPAQPQALREQVAAELAGIDAGCPVDPAYQRIRATVAGTEQARQDELHQMAEAAVARVTTGRGKKRTTTGTPPPVLPGRWPATAFVQTWTSLTAWWTHYDPAELAAELTEEQAATFLAVAAGTTEFAARLRRILTTDTSTEPAAGADSADESGREPVAGRHLRAL
jgi:ParB family chromosome partitioning protein